MKKEYIKIESIPAILWGNKSEKIYIYVHGKMASKDEALDFAEIAITKDYQVISFDLPCHGERKNEAYACNAWNAITDLIVVGRFVQENWSNISLFAVSFGAYFSLLAYKDFLFDKCLFLSPILNMQRLIENMMMWFNVDAKALKERQEIPTPMDETLSWKYYCYVKENPIEKWQVPTSILYGAKDNLTECEVIDGFIKRLNCDLTVLPEGQHYFQTENEIAF